MKILMLTPYLPYPPSTGGHVRSYNLIKRLARHHEITLVCFTRDHNTPDQVSHMEKYCKKVLVFERGKAWTIPNVFRTGFSLYPFLVMIYYTPEIRAKLAEEVRTGNYDLIHAETFYVLPYLPPTSLPTVLVEQTIMSRVFKHYVDTESLWFLRPLLLIDVAKINFWEKYYWKKSNRLIAVSEEDAVIMKRMVKDLKVEVVPNGVGEAFANTPVKTHYNHTILYMGNYKWMQNWEAARILAKDVFPLIKKKLSGAKLTITGQFPTPELKDLQNKDIKVVELEDSDQEGVVKAYQNAGLLIAPIYGPGGTRLKILAAMASMIPVVTTPIGAEGYGAKDGESILIGKTPEEIALKAIKVLTDKKLYAKIASNARKLVDVNFSWEPISQKLESIYENLVHP
ncbi:MAG: glycosyltransferase family 4 protein [Patescibacteria group bacterium]